MQSLIGVFRPSATLLLLIILAESAWSQCDCAARGYQFHQCQPVASCADCGCDSPGIPREPTPRGGPEPQQEIVTRETGYFQAPPRTGAFEGASGSVGLRAGAFVIPEIRIPLPSIELPSVFRVRRGAKMRINPAEASWISTGFESRAVTRAGVVEQRSDEQSPKARSRSTEDCSQLKREYEQKIETLNRKIQDCERLKKCIEDCLDEYPQLSQSNFRQQMQARIAATLDHPQGAVQTAPYPARTRVPNSISPPPSRLNVTPRTGERLPPSPRFHSNEQTRPIPSRPSPVSQVQPAGHFESTRLFESQFMQRLPAAD